tara:strand:- start:834 stop:1769 length:936 start_codon:yes stop_codon:yes gene_type:complete
MKLTKKSKIFLAGHRGMVGSAIHRKLIDKGYKNILVSKRKNLDLTKQAETFKFIKKNKPHLVIIAAAKVGGIYANQNYKDKFIYENLQIQNNLIHGSFLAGVKNLFLLGSSCIYPRLTKQPMSEKQLLTGKLEETNDAYAIAKIAGLKMCEYYSKIHNINFKGLMPPNLYGPNDNYNLKSSHFYPALLKKIYYAKIKKKKILEVWGTGKARRELMYVDDFADALIFFMNKKIKEPFINVGIGKDYPIKWYAKFLMKKIKVNLKIKYDKSKPDGMPKKLLDISLAKKYGWVPKYDFDKAFENTFKNFLSKKN